LANNGLTYKGKKMKIIFSVLIAALLLAGCSAGGMKDVQKSVFLHDYSQLKPGGDDQAALVYVKPGLDLKAYDKIMFDRMLVMLNDNSDYWAIDPAMLKELSDYYQQALIKAVEGAFQVVDQPGPGVLWVRVAITEIKPSKPVANTLSTILPVGWAVAGATKVASGENLGTGEAASEMEVLDSLTGERLAAAVDRRQGGKKAFSGEWNDTRDAFDYWATRFGQRLDEMRK
jgi:hypothetical protein